jgi:hypothetical protein
MKRSFPVAIIALNTALTLTTSYRLRDAMKRIGKESTEGCSGKVAANDSGARGRRNLVKDGN